MRALGAQERPVARREVFAGGAALGDLLPDPVRIVEGRAHLGAQRVVGGGERHRIPIPVGLPVVEAGPVMPGRHEGVLPHAIDRKADVIPLRRAMGTACAFDGAKLDGHVAVPAVEVRCGPGAAHGALSSALSPRALGIEQPTGCATMAQCRGIRPRSALWLPPRRGAYRLLVEAVLLLMGRQRLRVVVGVSAVRGAAVVPDRARGPVVLGGALGGALRLLGLVLRGDRVEVRGVQVRYEVTSLVAGVRERL
ncbi:hypothetical protein EBZ39_18335, partial [bacterium]|nr:hypothetical protein [bacterium]